MCIRDRADVGHHARFLAVDVYPLVFVEIGTDILFREVAHIRERQSGERTEQVAVSYTHLDVYKRQVKGCIVTFAGKPIIA